MEKYTVFECDLCFVTSDCGSDSLANHIYGISGSDMDHEYKEIDIGRPREKHWYEDVNGKEIHLCHRCLEMLTNKFKEKYPKKD